MADHYHFSWDTFDGVQTYDFIEDGNVIMQIPQPEAEKVEFDLLFADVEPGTHKYQVVGRNTTSSVESPVLEVTYAPLSGTITGFQYSIA